MLLARQSFSTVNPTSHDFARVPPPVCRDRLNMPISDTGAAGNPYTVPPSRYLADIFYQNDNRNNITVIAI